MGRGFLHARRHCPGDISTGAFLDIPRCLCVGHQGWLGLVGLTWSPELDALLVVGHAHAVVAVSLAIGTG